MRKLFARRPSAAMVVAVTALVASTAGPATADQIARIAQNITNSGQIRNGAVTGPDVRDESITTSDILNGSIRTEDIGTEQVQTADLAADAVRGDKILAGSIDDSDIENDTLRGADILEGSLGQVPSAARADGAGRADVATRADNATSADSATRAGIADTVDTIESFFQTIPIGQRVTLAQDGAVSIVGRCDAAGAGTTEGYVIAATTKEDSFFAGDMTASEDFGPSTPESNREFEITSSSSGRAISNGYADSFVVGHLDGSKLSGLAHTLVDQGPRTCTFLGQASSG